MVRWAKATLLGEGVIYPNRSINSLYKCERGVSISQILPGATVDQPIAVQTYLFRREPDDTQRATAQESFGLQGAVANGEDLPPSFYQ